MVCNFFIKNIPIAIIVGTILEDIITAGAGIVDDWICYKLG